MPAAIRVLSRIQDQDDFTGTLTGGQFLQWNGSSFVLAPVSPGGSSGQVQFNNAGAFGGAAALTYAASGALLTVTAQAASDVPLTLKGAALQSGNLLEARNSGGTLLSCFNSVGRLISANGGDGTPGIGFITAPNIGLWHSSSNIFVTAGASGVTNYVFGNTALAVNSNVSFIWTSGTVTVAGPDTGLARSSAAVVKITDGASGFGALICGAPTSSTVGLTVKGAPLQSVSLTEWQNSAGTVLARIGPGGTLLVNPTNTGTAAGIIKAAATKAPSVSNKALTANVATLTTSTAHGFFVGETVVVTGVDATFNGTYTIASVPSTTTFTYAKAAADVGSQTATGTATVGQTGNLLEVQNSSGTVLSAISASGYTGINGSPVSGSPLTVFSDVSSRTVRFSTSDGAHYSEIQQGIGACYFGTITNDAIQFMTANANRMSLGTTGTLTVTGFTSSSIGLVVKGAPSQAANLQEWQKSDTTVYATVSENGYFTTRKNATPADAELAAGEAAYWFDSTNGAAKFMVKAKQADGTVVTGTLALA